MKKWKLNHHTSMRTRLISLFIGMIVLPLGIASALLLSIQSHITESYVMDASENEIAQLADLLNQELKSVIRMGNLYYLDDELNEILLSQKDLDTPIQAEVMMEVTSKYTASAAKMYTEVSVLTPKHILYDNTKQPKLRSYASWADKTSSNRSNTTWLSAYDLVTNGLSQDRIYAVRHLHDRSTWEEIGLLIISMQKSELRKVFSGHLSETQNAYLLDHSGNLLTAINNQGLTYTPDFSRCSLYSGSFLDKSADTPQYVSYHTVSTNSWMLVVTSDYTAIRAPYKITTIAIIAVLLLYLLVSTVLSFVFADHYVRPIRQLCDNIALVKQGNFDTMVPVTSSDEIGHLSEQYNEMLLQIKELLNNIVTEQESRHTAEIQALQAQINPHFIYNSLASVRFLVFAKQNDEADKALLALINILRGTLSNPHALSTVKQEVTLLKDYIVLQKLSFSRPLTVEYDLDASVETCSICKLTLQPIVENVFIHGFASKQDDCRLTIRTRNCDSYAEITIEDNGVGFDTSTVQRKKWGEVDTPHNGLGMGNVHQRLVLNFGPEYGLRIDSTPGKGTTARITIPIKEEEGDVFIYDNSDR